MNLRLASVILFLFAAGTGGGVAWYAAQGETALSVPTIEVRAPRSLAAVEALDATRFKTETASVAATATAAPKTIKTAPKAVEPPVKPAPPAPRAVWPPPLNVQGDAPTSASVAAETSNAVIKAAYEGGQPPVFVTAAGLTEAGTVAHRYLAEARYQHLLAVADAYDTTIVGAQSLKPSSLEARIAEQMAVLAANLGPAPRKVAVVENKKTGAYVSPDTLWQGQELKAPVTEEVRKLLAAARSAAALTQYLKKLEPRHPQFRKLIEAARRYDQEICSKGDWGTVLVPKNSLGKTWSQPDAIKRLQERLAFEGLFKSTPTGVFGDETAAALKAFQSRTNLKPVGRLNRPTAKTLNIPCKRRVRVLALNAHRWRYSALTEDDTTYVHVNIPGFTLNYVRDGKHRARQRVIVGKGHSWYSPKKKRRIYRNATPVLSDVIHSVIFNPTWTVPYRVIINEIEPALKKDPEYLQKKGYVKRKRADGRDMYVQKPSKINALGDVKFYFPNSESIYLHDTNRRGLFVRSRRDFSHGCIRVHKAVEFATEVLKDDLVAKGEEYKGGLKTLANRDNTVRFPLHAPVAVHLEYYTATVQDDGVITFHPDIYDYDYAALVQPIGKQLPVWPPGT